MTVLQLQYLLSYLGYDTGGTDGLYGPKTRQAVTWFQEDFGGLEADGDAGEETQAALARAVGEGWKRPAEAGQPSGESPATGSFWADIQYFSRNDPGIRCPCGRCGGFPAEPTEELMRMADSIRRHFTETKGRETPMVPSSTLRCQAHNDSLKGSAKNSLHIQGRAMDFAVQGVPVSEVIAYTRQLQAGGEIRYTYEMEGTGYVHFDI